MRLHTLTFQAIGPYATSQHLDFELLDDVGLFLLDGPTGAGKSTILDIITFALYGKADDERKNTELYSTLAEPGVPPTIQLDVTFGTRRFVIDRTLQHFAPRRGATDPDDVVTRQASMTLTEIVAGERRPLTTRVDEAQQLLRGVIGLTREQFTSVVLLPQGQFAKFLKASSSERADILEQLFKTHRFEAIGEYLADQAKQLRGAVQADAQQRDTLRTGLIDTVQALSPEPVDLMALDETALLDHVETLMAQLEATAQQRVATTQTTLASTREVLQSLREQREQLREATDYRRRRTAHEAQTTEAQTAQVELTHHARALAVVTAQRHAEAALAERTRAVTTLQQHCDAAQQHPVIIQWGPWAYLYHVEIDELSQLAEEWKTVEATAIRAVEHVAHLEKTAATLEADQQRCTTLQSTRDTLTARIATQDAEFAALTEAIATDRQRVDVLAGAQATCDAATQRRDEATAQHHAAQRAHAAKQTLAETTARRDTTEQAAETALAQAQELLRRRIDAAAGFLAANLTAGQPCEVCGATEHPAPASSDALDEVSNATVQAAEQRATEARRAANDAAAKYQTALQAFQELHTQAGGLSLDAAEAALTQATSAVSEAQRAVAELSEVRARLTTREAELETRREAHAAAQQELTEVTTQLTSLTAELTRGQHHLTEELGDYGTVSLMRSTVETARHKVGQLIRAFEPVHAAGAAYQAATARVAEALEQSAAEEHPAYRDALEARRHVLSETERTEREALVQQWSTERDRLTEKAGQHAVVVGLKLLDDDVAEPSEEALNAAAGAQRDAEVAHAEANRHHGSVQTTRQQCRAQQDRLHELATRSAEQLGKYEELTGLSDVIAGRGENSLTMPLRSFVLAGWLEQVAANASERLTGMTGGRYELKHAVGQGGRGHSGLNLEVIDHLNDTVRTPSTLSGGETFMASLALALGLADAVQAQAGGVAMDTLFIDEGFGSLDAQTLDEVMGVLAALQDDGRLIGLVSHVESMKQQIPYRIQVTKTQAGSTVDILGPELA